MKLFGIFFAAALAVGAQADLGIGDAAPSLKFANLVKGSKVNLSKGVHVVEFWATWCGPCKTSIPHLTELAKKYQGKVSFTGVSVSERGADQLGQVTKFVKSMGNKMEYNIVWDGAEQFMNQNWMRAAKQSGIPTAFLVKDGQVLWIGHPMAELQPTIDQVLSGRYNVQTAKKSAAEVQAKRSAQMSAAKAMQAKLKNVGPALMKQDYKTAYAELEKLDKDPGMDKTQLRGLKLMVLNRMNDDRAGALSEQVAFSDSNMPADALNQLAWNLLDPAKPLNKAWAKSGLKIAQRAVEVSKEKDHQILDTYAVGLFRAGQSKKALEIMAKAISLAKSSGGSAKDLKEYQDRVAWIKKG